MDQTRFPVAWLLPGEEPEKRSANLLGLVAPCAAGAQLEAGGKDDGGVQLWSCIPLTTHDITAKPQAPMPAAVLTNSESRLLPPPIYWAR